MVETMFKNIATMTKFNEIYDCMRILLISLLIGHHIRTIENHPSITGGGGGSGHDHNGHGPPPSAMPK